MSTRILVKRKWWLDNPPGPPGWPQRSSSCAHSKRPSQGAKGPRQRARARVLAGLSDHKLLTASAYHNSKIAVSSVSPGTGSRSVHIMTNSIQQSNCHPACYSSAHVLQSSPHTAVQPTCCGPTHTLQYSPHTTVQSTCYNRAPMSAVGATTVMMRV